MKAECIKRYGNIKQGETIEIQRDYATNGVIYGYTVENHQNVLFLDKVLFNNHFKIMEDKSMGIKEIAKEMTREEFIQKYFYNENLCPSAIGIKNNCTGIPVKESGCKMCWENAVKDIEFKGEDENMKCANCGKTINKNGAGEFCSCKCLEEYVGNDYNPIENKIDYDKEYSFKEVVAKIKIGEEYYCTDSDLAIKNINMGENSTLELVTDGCPRTYIRDAIFKLKRKEREVGFIEAVKIYRTEYKTIENKYLGTERRYCFNINGMINEFGDAVTAAEILNGTWYVLD